MSCSICVQSSPLRIGIQRVSLCSRARISAGVLRVSPAARTASGNLTAEAGARQHRGMLLGWGRTGENRHEDGKGEDRGRRTRGKVGGRVGQRAEREKDMINTLN